MTQTTSPSLEYPAAPLFASLTVKVALVLVGVAFLAIFIGAGLAYYGVAVPLLSDFIDFLKVIFAGTATRNIISDGIMPRVPQAFAAAHEGSSALSVSTAAPMEQPPKAPPVPVVFDPYALPPRVAQERPP